MSSYNLSWVIVLTIVAIILLFICLFTNKDISSEKSFTNNINAIYFNKKDTFYEYDRLGKLIQHFSDSSVVSVKYKTIEAHRFGEGIFINKIH